jgi:hypothetical protein
MALETDCNAAWMQVHLHHQGVGSGCYVCPAGRTSCARCCRRWMLLVSLALLTLHNTLLVSHDRSRQKDILACLSICSK